MSRKEGKEEVGEVQTREDEGGREGGREGEREVSGGE